MALGGRLWQLASFLSLPAYLYTAIGPCGAITDKAAPDLLSLSNDEPAPSLPTHSIRAVAFGLVSAADAPTRAIWRDLLKTELVLFQSDYGEWSGRCRCIVAP